MPKLPPLSAAEAANQKDIAKRTILHAIATGQLKARKVGGAGYVIEQRDLDRWVAKRKQNGAVRRTDAEAAS